MPLPKVFIKFGPYALIVALPVIFSLFVVNGQAYGLARKHASDWTENLKPAQNKMLANFSEIEATALERERLIAQLDLANNRAAHHLEVTIYFFSNYYVAIIQCFLFGAVAAVALFFIAKTGFEKANPHVVCVFLTATVIATTFGAFPSVFRQSDNIADNKALYLRYVALQNQMLTYSATGRTPSGQVKSASEYIVDVDEQLNSVNNLAIGFDFSKIPKFDLESN